MKTRGKRGFTLTEILIVVLIIGVLASFAATQYIKVVEKSRFAEANDCFSTIKGSQARYLMRTNTYAAAVTSLDMACSNLKTFSAPGLTNVTASAFSAVLTRANPTTYSYGAYVITFTIPGGTYGCSNSNCSQDLTP